MVLGYYFTYFWVQVPVSVVVQSPRDGKIPEPALCPASKYCAVPTEVVQDV